MSGLRDWLLGLLAAAMLGLLCRGIGGEDRPVLRLCTGLILLLVLCSPAVHFDLGELSQLLAETRARAAEITAGAEGTLEASISAQTEAYILDKAAELGLTLQVEVRLAEGDCPYPVSVRLTGRSTTAQRRSLNRWLTAELAIAEEEITWNEAP